VALRSLDWFRIGVVAVRDTYVAISKQTVSIAERMTSAVTASTVVRVSVPETIEATIANPLLLVPESGYRARPGAMIGATSDGSGLPEFPPTLWALVVDRAQRTPDRVALEDDRGRTLTAAGLRDAAERVAAGLQARGIGPDVPVSWQLPSTIDAVVLLLALARLGAVQNPIIPILRRREVGFIVEQTAARLLITPGVWRGFDHAAMAAALAAEHGLDTMVVGDGDGELPTGDPATLPPPPDGAGDPVRHVYYTSGSTADPKGARHTDRTVMAGATGMLTAWRFEAGDHLPVNYPFTHIGGICNLVALLHRGGCVCMVEVFDRERSPLTAGFRRATLLGSAVPFFHAYLDAQRGHGPEPLYPHLRMFSGGGAPKPPELYYEMKEVFGVGIVSGWGLTEFPVATAGSVDDTDEELAHTEGRPVPGVEVRVVGADGRDVPPGGEGELRLRGPQCCKGYLDAALDADAFDEGGWFRTGDLGVVGPRGHVRITGRLKDIIIRNAENISAQEIEDVLYTHPKVADVAVIGVPDRRTGERACAVVVPVDGAGAITLAELADFCRGVGLAAQKIPERLEVVDALPRNAMGKVLKRELRTTFA